MQSKILFLISIVYNEYIFKNTRFMYDVSYRSAFWLTSNYLSCYLTSVSSNISIFGHNIETTIVHQLYWTVNNGFVDAFPAGHNTLDNASRCMKLSFVGADVVSRNIPNVFYWILIRGAWRPFHNGHRMHRKPLFSFHGSMSPRILL